MVEPFPASSEPEPPVGPRAEPPSSVRLAVNLIWVGIALSIVNSLLTFVFLDDVVDQAIEAAGGSATLDRDAAQLGAVVGVVVTLVFTVALYVLFAIFIRKGANWARIVYTVLAVLGLLLSLVGIAGQPALQLVLSLVGIALTVATLVLLFRPESNRYFSGQRPAV